MEGHDLAVSNLEKVLYPSTGFRKGDVLQYYAQVAPVVVPHLEGRPLTLKRYPEGVEKPFFYQKSCPPHPGWMGTTRVPSEQRGEPIDQCVVDGAAALLFLVNLGNLELHSFLARGDDLERPTMVMFDLDPGPGAGLQGACQAALWVRDLLRDVKLECHAKVSGSKGVQVAVPLNTPATYDETKALSRWVATRLEREHPDCVTSNMRKDLRGGRVLVDWSQNSRHKSTVAVHSLRATLKPRVSAPITWKEAESGAQGAVGELVFDPAAALARLARHGDLWAPVLEQRQRLPSLDA